MTGLEGDRAESSKGERRRMQRAVHTPQQARQVFYTVINTRHPLHLFNLENG